ncbi:MAG: hypothetical protein HY923_03010 [Elusimicrobia bacterium]|nr:hypothetical protein [Elusimicrobiota bacterium]
MASSKTLICGQTALWLLFHASAHAGGLDAKFEGELFPWTNGIFRLCEDARMTCGVIENYDPRIYAPLVSKPVNSKTVRGAFDELLQPYPNYEWAEVGTSIIIRPKKMSRAVTEKLYHSPVSITFKDADTHGACRGVLERVKIYTNFSSSGMAPKYGYISAEIQNQSVVAALNEIAKRDGQVMWHGGYWDGWLYAEYTFGLSSWRRERAMDPAQHSRSK